MRSLQEIIDSYNLCQMGIAAEVETPKDGKSYYVLLSRHCYEIRLAISKLNFDLCLFSQFSDSLEIAIIEICKLSPLPSKRLRVGRTYRISSLNTTMRIETMTNTHAMCCVDDRGYMKVYSIEFLENNAKE